MGGKLSGSVRDGSAPAASPSFRERLAGAVGGDPRDQQVQQQRDGAAALPHAGTDPRCLRLARGLARGAAPLARRAHRPPAGRGCGDRQRLRPVARDTPDCAATRAPAAVGLGQRGDAGTGGLAARLGHRRHAGPLEGPRGARAPEDRVAADVAGVAGYVLAQGGRRYVVVAIVNHPNANAARPAIDSLVQWVVNEPAPRHRPPETQN